MTNAKEWIDAQIQPPQPQIPHLLNPLPEIELDSSRCFTDAAWQGVSQTAGFGWILLDPLNHPIAQGSSNARNVGSPLLAEAEALYLAIHQASDLGLKKLSFALDSQQLVKALNGEPFPNELHGILHDISSLSLNFVEISFSYVRRENNRKADSLAKAALALMTYIQTHID